MFTSDVESDDDETDDSDDEICFEKTLDLIKNAASKTQSDHTRTISLNVDNVLSDDAQFGTDKTRLCRNRLRVSELENCEAIESVSSAIVDTHSTSSLWRIPLNTGTLSALLSETPQFITVLLGSRTRQLTYYLRKHSERENIQLLLRLFSKACVCQSAPQYLLQILSVVKDSDFISVYVPDYLNYKKSEAGSDIKRNNELDTTLSEVLAVMKCLLFRMPSSFSDVSGLLDLIECLSNSPSQILKDQMEEVKCLQKQAFGKVADNISIGKEEETPPDNFRDLSIFPTTSDIHQGFKPYLRANKAVGGYNNLEHYLDVQFRLLREDFLCPLREGIEEYNRCYRGHAGLGNEKHDIMVYTNVEVICPCGTNEGTGYRLKFNVNGIQPNWVNSKRLMYGSLLCLSRDDFDTIQFATVVKSEPFLLRMGIVDIIFHEEKTESISVCLSQKYVVAETTAYFEAYKHILYGIKNTFKGDLPFENHIVDCEKCIGPPLYIDDESTWDLRPLLQDNLIICHKRRLPIANENERNKVKKIEQDKRALKNRNRRNKSLSEAEDQLKLENQSYRLINILDFQEWPSADDLQLDLSQYEALKLALTHRLAIIQGPPGTGKTHLGLKVMKVILQNTRQIFDSKPVLVICYTNHALDQFLEGILEFYSGDVVRVGGRSRSEIMKTYSLANYRIKFRRNMDANFNKEFRKLNTRKKKVLSRLQRLAMEIYLTHNSILHEDTLESEIGQYNLSCLKIRKDMSFDVRSSYILPWLNFNDHRSTDRRNYRSESVRKEGMKNEYIGAIQEIINLRKLDDDESVEKTDLFETTLSRDFKIAYDLSNVHNGNRNVRNPLTKFAAKQFDLKPLSAREVAKVNNVWASPLQKRWRLYKYWVSLFCKKKEEEIEPLKEEYEESLKMYRDMQNQLDLEILQKARIIGMTTTGAAKYQGVLRDIGPRIIVIEEAAEVLEAHIITSLSPSCQHLILIGDHKQLRPNPTTYKLAKQFNLDISLFERLINNGLSFSCLEYQHRMRPEISCLVKFIYPQLQDDDIVTKYDNVKGVKTNLFFISHSEEEITDEETRSFSNHHEATFLEQFSRYLFKQGSSEESITIITPYTGQQRLLSQLLPKRQFPDLTITTIDNYQGEENDIILLSLVRSNLEGNIGFLKTDNRVCVALSRAKHGMYVIGNMNQFAVQSNLWNKILDLLTTQNKIGPSLGLICQIHKQNGETKAKSSADFIYRVPHGGCDRKCSSRLPCGHVCTLHCHPYDHSEYKCLKPCIKVKCTRNHKCMKKCYEDCGDCLVGIESILDKCGHAQLVPCFMDPSEYVCKEVCSYILPCGHVCKEMCGEEHTKLCNSPVAVTWPCGHRDKHVPCSSKSIDSCSSICHVKLKCEHMCQGICIECRSNGHKPCTATCDKVLYCKHRCTGVCSDCSNGRHKACTEVCNKWLICGHKCRKLCREPCVCREHCMFFDFCKCHGKCIDCNTSGQNKVLHISMRGNMSWNESYSECYTPTRFSKQSIFSSPCSKSHLTGTGMSEYGRIFISTCGHHIDRQEMCHIFTKYNRDLNILEPFRCPVCNRCIIFTDNYRLQLEKYIILKCKVNALCKSISGCLQNLSIYASALPCGENAISGGGIRHIQVNCALGDTFLKFGTLLV